MEVFPSFSSNVTCQDLCHIVPACQLLNSKELWTGSLSGRVKASCPPIISALKLSVCTNGSPSKTRFLSLRGRIYTWQQGSELPSQKFRQNLKSFSNRPSLGVPVSQSPDPGSRKLAERLLTRPLTAAETTATGIHETDWVTWYPGPSLSCFL